MDSGRFEKIGFGVTLVIVTVAAALVAWPFAFALLWAVVAGIVFRPLQERMLTRTNGREGRAALLSILVIVLSVVIPLALVASMVVDEAAALYMALQTGGFDVASYFVAVHDGLPSRLRDILDSSGYGDLEGARLKIAELVRSSLGLIATSALTIGGNALSLVLSFGVGLYVTYFLLRDGERLSRTLCEAMPLPRDVAGTICTRIASIVRATVKGSLVVGVAQGGLGAITFLLVGVPSAVLLGVVMALASLLPAVGPALVWVPVAAWLFFAGDVMQAVIVTISGVLVIGMVDNVLRPVLVGKDTGIPDWVILVTTLGGISTFGLSGIVIGPVVAGLFMTCWSMSLEIRSRRIPAAVPGDAGTP